MSKCFGLLLPGEAPFGSQGFVFAAILCIVLVVLVNELAAPYDEERSSLVGIVTTFSDERP